MSTSHEESAKQRFRYVKDVLEGMAQDVTKGGTSGEQAQKALNTFATIANSSSRILVIEDPHDLRYLISKGLVDSDRGEKSGETDQKGRPIRTSPRANAIYMKTGIATAVATLLDNSSGKAVLRDLSLLTTPAPVPHAPAPQAHPQPA